MKEQKRETGKVGPQGRDPGAAPNAARHVYPVLATLVVVLALAFVARTVAVPKTFGEYGWYRGAAPEEARQFTPRHVGKDACEECHDDVVAEHDKDVHVNVPCEACHGPGGKHVETEEATDIIRPKGREVCLTCHRRLLTRPGAFPQINWKEHFKFVGVKDESTKCISCHNPHEPLFLDRDIHKARLHPLIQRCGDCHLGMSNKAKKPEKHPVIFECSYCHEAKVKDFKQRTHSRVSCTTCHLFFKETSYSGRIIRDADPRFCLLCHRDAPFRSVSAAPSIDWPDHLEEVKEGPEDEGKRCIDCHRDRIHAPKTAGREP